MSLVPDRSAFLLCFDAHMTDWAALRHAYGTAEDVPALLAAAEESGTDFGPA